MVARILEQAQDAVRSFPAGNPDDAGAAMTSGSLTPPITPLSKQKSSLVNTALNMDTIVEGMPVMREESDEPEDHWTPPLRQSSSNAGHARRHSKTLSAKDLHSCGRQTAMPKRRPAAQSASDRDSDLYDDDDDDGDGDGDDSSDGLEASPIPMKKRRMVHKETVKVDLDDLNYLLC